MSIVTSLPALNNTASNVYVSSGSTAVTWLSLTNESGSNVFANVYAVPSGESANATNIILANLLVTGGDTYQLYQAGEKLLLDTGDTIQANATANIAVVVSYTSI